MKCNKIIVLTLIVLLTGLNCCYAQKKPLPANYFRDIDVFVKVYADSINNFFKNDSIIPSFLHEVDFDQRPFYWVGSHSPVSLRYALFKKVHNVDALLEIRDTADSLMKLTSQGNIELLIPFRQYSFYDLIVLRINELRFFETYNEYKRRSKGK